MELNASVAACTATSSNLAIHGVVPFAVLETEAAGLAPDDTARARLPSELSRLSLHVETPLVPVTPLVTRET